MNNIMKSLKVFLIVIIGFIIGLPNVVAQNNPAESEVIKNLTTEQKELLNSQKELLKENRDAFKASLSEEQLMILNDQSVPKADRQKALLQSLSVVQKNLIKQNKEIAKINKEIFRASFTIEQRIQIKNQLRQIRDIQGSKELREIVKERRKNRRNNN